MMIASTSLRTATNKKPGACQEGELTSAELGKAHELFQQRNRNNDEERDQSRRLGIDAAGAERSYRAQIRADTSGQEIQEEWQRCDMHRVWGWKCFSVRSEEQLNSQQLDAPLGQMVKNISGVNPTFLLGSSS